MRKKCSKCGIIKDTSEFYKSNSNRDRVSNECKECIKSDNKKRRERYKELHNIDPTKHPEGEKRCPTCAVSRDASEFSKNRANKDGLASCCKKCTKIKNKVYREAHKHDRSYIRARKESNRRYCETHKRKREESIRKYHETHRVKESEYSKKYFKSEKGKATKKRYKQKRRARTTDAIADLTVEQWNKILKSQNYRCNICGRKFAKSNHPTQDHIIPAKRGGVYSSENIQALCLSCNSRKNAKLDYQYIQTWTLSRSNTNILNNDGTNKCIESEVDSAETSKKQTFLGAQDTAF